MENFEVEEEHEGEGKDDGGEQPEPHHIPEYVDWIGSQGGVSKREIVKAYVRKRAG